MQKNNLLEKDVAITVPIEKEVTKIDKWKRNYKSYILHISIYW